MAIADGRFQVARIYNLRADPFESYDTVDSNGHLLQKQSWLMAPISEMIAAHVKTLVDYPPVQGGTTFDMSKTIEDAMKKSQQ